MVIVPLSASISMAGDPIKKVHQLVCNDYHDFADDDSSNPLNSNNGEENKFEIEEELDVAILSNTSNLRAVLTDFYKVKNELLLDYFGFVVEINPPPPK